ncbi:MAG TPA: transglutaminase-like domain-containing protein [Spirochaetota bacterium]|nr:transglutaminase-like domain-containing protein [Spirochaetota bacterium]
MTSQEQYLLPGTIIDSDSTEVISYTESILEGKEITDVEKAVLLYYHIRDGIRYDPYIPFYRPEHYRSSGVIKSGKGFCIQKAGLLCAAARVAGIPSRIGFATVKNHIATKQFTEYLGSNIIAPHGYSELWLEGKWVKATPAFNADLCRHFRVKPLNFNGHDDSIMHEFNSDNNKFMEYLSYHGEFQDIPLDIILNIMKETYGEERVSSWIAELEKADGGSWRDFSAEDIA